MNNLYTITANNEIAKDVFKLSLRGDTSKITHSGQFINIKVEGVFLRRPISIYDYDEYTITVVYKVFGKGTKLLSEYKIGSVIDCLVGLGNGFQITQSENTVLVGGGIGIPPLYNLAKQLKDPVIVLGFKNKDELFLIEEFKKLGCIVIVCTDDGSAGFHGNVVHYLKNTFQNYYYACGPEPMLLSLVKDLNIPGQLSFESRMACGFGACMGCSKLTKNGSIRVCVEGPVLESEVVIYED